MVASFKQVSGEMTAAVAVKELGCERFGEMETLQVLSATSRTTIFVVPADRPVIVIGEVVSGPVKVVPPSVEYSNPVAVTVGVMTIGASLTTVISVNASQKGEVPALSRTYTS